MQTHHILRRYHLIISPSSMKSKLSIFPRISCFYLILRRFSSSLSMAKRTVEVKLPSACPRRHSNPVLIVPLQHYVVVGSGSTPLQIKPQAETCTTCCFLFYTCASRPYILLESSQVKYKGFILWDPALRCSTPVGFVGRATLFSSYFGVVCSA